MHGYFGGILIFACPHSSYFCAAFQQEQFRLLELLTQVQLEIDGIMVSDSPLHWLCHVRRMWLMIMIAAFASAG